MNKNKMCERLMMLVLGITVISFANGQTMPTCAQQLSPCINFLNSTNPPETCCNPIKEMDATQEQCFCQLALTPGILEGLGISLPQALQLLQSCGANFKITICKASSSVPPQQPPATVRGDEGGTSRATTTFSGLSFALFLCVHVLFN